MVSIPDRYSDGRTINSINSSKNNLTVPNNPAILFQSVFPRETLKGDTFKNVHRHKPPQGYFVSPGDIWQCLETFLVVTIWIAGGGGVASSEEEPRVELNTPQEGTTWPQMSIVLRLQKP
jgi:hypothetical protein